MIGVIGATGNIGRVVVKELKQFGQDPVCVVRDANKAREVLGADAKIAVADLADTAALKRTLRGVTSLSVVMGNDPQMLELENNVLDAAMSADAEYLVRVSGTSTVSVPDCESFVGRCHCAMEERLRKCGMQWAILQPGVFTQNALMQAASIKSDSKMVWPFAGNLPLAMTDVRDIGAIGARVLMDRASHAGKTYSFTGELTTFEQFAEVLSQALRRKITYVAITAEQLEKEMKAFGVPDWMISHLVAMSRLGASGGFSVEDTKPIHDLLKRPPLSTTQFVEDYKALFA